MSFCNVKECYAFGGYCRIPGHMKKEDKPAVAPTSAIKPVADDRKQELKEYGKLRKVFLTKNYKCQVKGCGNAAAEIHHKQGRENGRLLEVEYFLAVCNSCHRKITDDSAWAIEQGYSLSRLATEEPPNRA